MIVLDYSNGFGTVSAGEPSSMLAGAHSIVCPVPLPMDGKGGVFVLREAGLLHHP